MTHEETDEQPSHEICEGKQIKVKCIDECDDTYVTVGCYRETGRLGRVLDVFQKAITLAYGDGQHNVFKNALASLHDHKGELTARWHSVRLFPQFQIYVEKAWMDCGEHQVRHELVNGTSLEVPENAHETFRPMINEEEKVKQAAEAERLARIGNEGNDDEIPF